MSRESIEVALFAKLQTVVGFTTIGRKHVMPPTLQPDQQPALFIQSVHEEKSAGPRGLPGRTTITYLVFVYCHDSAADDIPGQEASVLATTLNTLKDAIDTALSPDPSTGVQTLGDTVSHCWVEGETTTDPGIFGKQGFAIVPVKVLVP